MPLGHANHHTDEAQCHISPSLRARDNVSPISRRLLYHPMLLLFRSHHVLHASHVLTRWLTCSTDMTNGISSGLSVITLNVLHAERSAIRAASCL